ncbi:MAG: hypothetical protein QOF90_3586 [Acetobacteraceae bacterium]|nr:hypothetical protein [Acetobacteraceae bacterium]
MGGLFVLYRHHHWLDDELDGKAAERQTANLVGIVIILLLLIGGLFLVHRLRNSSILEDCLLAGRRDCDILLAVPQ